MPITFLDLPRELRNLIYQDLWLHTPNIFFKNGLTEQIHASYACVPDDYCYRVAFERLPVWLPTCKQVFNEAIEEFTRKATWVYHVYGEGYKATSLPPIYFKLEVRHIEATLVICIMRNTGILAPLNLGILERTLNHVVPMGNLQEVTLCMQTMQAMPTWKSIDIERIDQIDLSELGSMLSRMRLRRVNVIWSTGFKHPDVNHPRVLEYCRSAVKELGRMVMGGDPEVQEEIRRFVQHTVLRQDRDGER